MESAALQPGTASGVEHDVAGWQQAFDASEALFASLSDGARMGFIAQPGFAPLGRRRAGLDAAVVQHAGTAMLAFCAAKGRIEVTVERFASFEETELDLLFVADEAARAELAAAPAPTRLRAMKRLIRRGSMRFFVLRTRHELEDAGYEDFLESLGVPFLGSCR
jgi:hypothetical protein